jgi:hypothetical protein
MDLISLLRIVVRRWAVVVPIILLSVVAAVLVGRVADPLYEISGSLLVAPPTFTASSSDSARFNVDELAAAIRRDDALSELRADDELVAYTIDDATDGLLQVIATGASDTATEATADTVAALLVQELIAVQEAQEVPEAARVRPRLVNEQAVAQESTSEGGAQQFVANVEVVLDQSFSEIENPYSASPSTARILQVAVMSAESEERVRNLASEDIAFEVYQDQEDRVPILEVATYASSPEGAMRGFEAVTETLSELLDERQERAGVPPTERLLVEVIAAPGDAKDVSPPIERSAAVTLALGLLAAGGAALAIESLKNRRRPPQSPGQAAVASDPAKVLWPSPATPKAASTVQQPPDDLSPRYQSRP